MFFHLFLFFSLFSYTDEPRISQPHTNTTVEYQFNRNCPVADGIRTACENKSDKRKLY